MEVRIFGMLEVGHGDRWLGPNDLGGRKPKQLLQLLAAAQGHPAPKDVLVEQLWTSSPRHPRAALDNLVWVLRRHLHAVGPELAQVVVVDRETYRLATDRVDLDLQEFDRLIAQADRRPLQQARPDLEAALALARADAFEDEPYADWAVAVRERCRLKVQRAMLDAAEAALLAGDLRGGIRHATEAMEREPLSERACRMRMWGLVSQGERELALRVFESFRELLRIELGLEPHADTIAIRDQARSGAGPDPRLISPDGLIDLNLEASPRGPRQPAGRRHPSGVALR